jgi:hypothetical protein
MIDSLIIGRNFKDKRARPQILIGLLILLLLTFGLLVYLEGLNVTTLVDFVKNLLPEVITFFIAILFIEFWIDRQRSSVLRNINQSHSRSVEFQINRLAVQILGFLNYFDLKDSKMLYEFLGKDLNFRPGFTSFKSIGSKELAKKYFIQLNSASNKVQHVHDFVDILQDYGGKINVTVEKIYPIADPKVRTFFESDFFVYQGSVNAVGSIFKSFESDEFKQWKASHPTEDTEHLYDAVNLLVTKFNPDVVSLENLFQDLININKLAYENKLFINIKL